MPDLSEWPGTPDEWKYPPPEIKAEVVWPDDMPEDLIRLIADLVSWEGDLVTQSHMWTGLALAATACRLYAEYKSEREG